MSDTPRTDAAIGDYGYYDAVGSRIKQDLVAPSFARTLERDLAEAVRLLEELLADCDADLKPTKKHPARVFLTSLKERT